MQLPKNLQNLSKYIYLALLISAFLLGYWAHKPDNKPVKPTKLIENPTKEQEKKADIVIEKNSQGHATGSIKTGGNSGQVLRTIPTPDGNTPEKDPGLPGAFTGLKEGIYSVPISGDIKTRYVDKKTGQYLGEGSSPLTGTTTVTVGNNILNVDTTFNSVTVEALYITKAQDFKNEIGLTYNGELGLYYRRYLFTWNTKHFEIAPFAEIKTNLTDRKVEGIAAGLLTRF
jgi:hypothetical protein